MSPEDVAQTENALPGDILSDKEALELVRSYYAIPENQRRRLFELARVLVGHRRLSASGPRGLTRKPGHATSDRVAGPGRRTDGQDTTT